MNADSLARRPAACLTPGDTVELFLRADGGLIIKVIGYVDEIGEDEGGEYPKLVQTFKESVTFTERTEVVL